MEHKPKQIVGSQPRGFPSRINQTPTNTNSADPAKNTTLLARVGRSMSLVSSIGSIGTDTKFSQNTVGDDPAEQAIIDRLQRVYSVEKLRFSAARKFTRIFRLPGARVTDQLCRSESRQAGFSCDFCYPLVTTVRKTAQIANEIAALIKSEFFKRIRSVISTGRCNN